MAIPAAIWQDRARFGRIFKWQYLLTREADADLPMDCQRLGRWQLFHGPGLPVARLTDAKGQLVGLLAGIGVEPDGRLVEGRHALPALRTGFWDGIESWLEDLTGRYIVLLSGPGGMRLYTDPVGMLGAVVDPHAGRVGAGLGLVCHDREIVPHPDYDHSLCETIDGKYSLLDTRDAHVRRMNPNCWLSLEDFSETRFWPRPGSIVLRQGSLVRSYGLMAHRTRLVVGALARHRPTALPLSAGMDSRLLLGMAGTAASDLSLVYSHESTYANRVDSHIAGRLAERAGLRHTRHRPDEVTATAEDTAADIADFHVAMGWPAPPSVEMANGVLRHLPEDMVVLRGHQTDLLRAVFSHKEKAQAELRRRWLLKRLLLVPHDRFGPELCAGFEPRLEAWYQSLPPEAKARQVDFMFLELYYTSTIAASFPAISRVLYMSPFNGRRQIGHALAIEESYRRAGLAVHDLLHQCRADLLDEPFDDDVAAAGGLQGYRKNDHLKLLLHARRAVTRARLRSLSGGGLPPDAVQLAKAAMRP